MDSTDTDEITTSQRSAQSTPSWVHLNNGEQLLWFGRSSRWTLVPIATITVLLIGLGIVGSIFMTGLDLFEGSSDWIAFLPLVFSALGVCTGLLAYIRWRFRVYVITSDELYEKWGLISRNVNQMRIKRVQNTRCNQSVIERVLSFGDITIFTAGSDDHDFSLQNVPKPQSINRVLNRQLDAPSASEGTDD